MVMAPENPLIDKYAHEIANMNEVEEYRNMCAKTEFERTQLKEKDRCMSEGLRGYKPSYRKENSIYIADRVMMGWNGCNNGCSGS